MRYSRTIYMKMIAVRLFARPQTHAIDPRKIDDYLMRDIGLTPPARSETYFEYL